MTIVRLTSRQTQCFATARSDCAAEADWLSIVRRSGADPALDRVALRCRQRPGSGWHRIRRGARREELTADLLKNVAVHRVVRLHELIGTALTARRRGQ